MSTDATITFTAKRRTYQRFTTEGVLESGEGYRIPLLCEKHLQTPHAQREGWMEDYLGSRLPADRAIHEARLDAVLDASGFGRSRVILGRDARTNERVQIEQLGRGFMARVTLTLAKPYRVGAR